MWHTFSVFIGHLYAFFANKYIQVPFLLKNWVICHLLLSCKSFSCSREREVCTAFLLSLGSEQGKVFYSGSRPAANVQCCCANNLLSLPF